MKSQRASSTAKVIAASTILLDSEQDPNNPVALGAAELCQKFLSTRLSDRWLAACACHPLGRRPLRLLAKFTLPGIIEHYWRRKRWIELRTREAIAQGFRRIVIIGAGFDTLGLRLATEFPGVSFVELDHPATQAVKRDALCRHHVTDCKNFTWIALDLTKNKLPDSLRSDQKTLLILEGLLMYLTAEEVTTLFHQLTIVTSKPPRVMFSFMTRWPDGSSGFRPRSRIIESWLCVKKEPFLWSIKPELMDGFLKNLGFELLEMALTHELDSHLPLASEALRGENLVVAEGWPKP